LVAGCGKKPVDPVPAKPRVAPTMPAPAPEPVRELLWPLTAIPGPIVERPALAVKIENSPQARPQAGLNQADVVWEEVVEGGISRFVAVFHSQLPESVGPIRSVRPMDGPIAGPTGGLLVFSGGQSRFISIATEAGLQVLGHDQGADGFFRDPGRRGEHSLMGRPDEFLAQANAEHQAPPEPEFQFAPSAEEATAVVVGSAGMTVDIRLSGWSNPGWDWDEALGAWLRREGSDQATVEGGQQIMTTNLVALKVEVRMAGGTDAAGSQIPESIMVGSGLALVACEGKTMDATWSKESVTAPVVLTSPDGQPILLSPGNTWVELVPVGDGSWTVS